MEIVNLEGLVNRVAYWRRTLQQTDLADHLLYAAWHDDAEAKIERFLARIKGCTGAGQIMMGSLGPNDELDAFALYRPSEWDSRFFKVASGFLDCLWCRRGEDYSSFVPQLCQALGRMEQKFVAAKLPLNSWPRVQALEEAGARLVDSELIMIWDKLDPQPISSGRPWTIRQADENDAAALKELDIPFAHGRFFNDPRINGAAAKEIWQQAMVNSLSGLAHWVLLAEVERRPAGLVTIQKNQAAPGGPAEANLFIVGAEKRWHGTGLMQDLMTAAIQIARRECERVLVEVSLANRRALNFYFKAGFNRLLYGKTVLHLWLEQGH